MKQPVRAVALGIAIAGFVLTPISIRSMNLLPIPT